MHVVRTTEQGYRCTNYAKSPEARPWSEIQRWVQRQERHRRSGPPHLQPRPEACRQQPESATRPVVAAKQRGTFSASTRRVSLAPGKTGSW